MIACAAQFDVAEVAVMASLAILVGAQIVEYNTNSITQVGIAFESGSGDYAEWLERADYQEELSFGDIVGVKGGKISKNFSNPDHFMVVSMSPIVLGNMPKEGFEENFEKIAFMGQVPVKVLGKVNIGDYILASTRKDGMGYAVNPKDLKLSEMNRIVGVAWSESQENSNLNLINVAVGINSNDMSLLVQQQQAELNDVKSQMNQLISYLKEKDSSLNIPFMDVQESPSYPIMATTEKTQEPVVQMTVKTEDSYEMVRSLQSTMKKVLDERNIDYTLYDQTNRLVNDADYLIEMFPEVLNKIMK